MTTARGDLRKVRRALLLLLGHLFANTFFFSVVLVVAWCTSVLFAVLHSWSPFAPDIHAALVIGKRWLVYVDLAALAVTCVHSTVHFIRYLWEER